MYGNSFHHFQIAFLGSQVFDKHRNNNNMTEQSQIYLRNATYKTLGSMLEVLGLQRYLFDPTEHVLP